MRKQFGSSFGSGIGLLMLVGITLVVASPGVTRADETKDPGEHEAPTNGQDPAIDSSIDESSGKARYSLPIEVPPGPGGLQPDLSLEYDGTTRNGPFGIGWDLRIPEVRCSSRFGVPGSLAQCGRFELDGELLVEGPAGPNYREFRTSVETFRRIRFFASSNHWEATSPDGTVSRFGTGHSVATPSRIADSGANPKTVVWKLTSRQDTFGNEILYGYSTLGDSGFLYPVSIEWAGGERGVLIEYESTARPDPIHDFRGGVETTIRSRASGIRVTSGAGTLSQLVIRYEAETGDTVYGVDQSRIRAVRRLGVENCLHPDCIPAAPMPETKFEYSNNAISASTSSQWTNDLAAGLWWDASGNPMTPPQMANVKFADVNGDGRQDAMRALCPSEYRPCTTSTPSGLWQVWLKGDAGWTLDTNWSNQLASLTWAAPAISVQYTTIVAGEATVNQQPTWQWNETISDGQYTYSTCAASATAPVTQRVYFTNGNDRFYSVTDPNTILAYANWQVADLDGDGRSDLIVSSRVGGLWITHDCATNTRLTTPTYFEGPAVRIAFMNTGAGWAPAPAGYTANLPDFSRTFISSQLAFAMGNQDHALNTWYQSSQLAAPWAAPDFGWWYRNASNPAEYDVQSFCANHGLGSTGKNIFSYTKVTGCIAPIDYSPQFVELNGDGLVDIIVLEPADVQKLPYNGGAGDFQAHVASMLDIGVNPTTAQAYLQTADGSGFERAAVWDLPFPHVGLNAMAVEVPIALPVSGLDDLGVRLVDLNNDSLTDVIWVDPALAYAYWTPVDRRLIRPHDTRGVLINSGSGWCSSDDQGPCESEGVRYRMPDGFEFARRPGQGAGLFPGGDAGAVGINFADGATAHLATVTRPVELTDVNGDGLLDVVLAERWPEFVPISGSSVMGIDWQLEARTRLHDPTAVGPVWHTDDTRYAMPMGFNSIWSYGPPTAVPIPGSGAVGYSARWMDVDDDGVADLMLDSALYYQTQPGFGFPNIDWDDARFLHSNSSLPDMLTEVDNGRGGRIEFAYQTGMQARGNSIACDGSPAALANRECIARIHASALQSLDPSLRETLTAAAGTIVDRWTRDPVVKSIRRIALNQPSTVPATEFAYALPRWDLENRVSLGFRIVARTLPTGAYDERLYYQSPGLAGKISRRTLYHDVTRANPIRCERSTYRWRDGSTVNGSFSGVDIGRLESTISFNEYGTSCDDLSDRGAVRLTGLSYDDAYGFNFVSSSGSYSTSRGGVHVENEPYEPSNSFWTDNWIVGLKGSTITREGGATGNIVSGETYAYWPHGRIRILSRQLTDRIPYPVVGPSDLAVTSSYYDTNGNLAREVDPDGLTTDFCFDGDSTFAFAAAPCPASAQQSHSVKVGTRNNMGKIDGVVLHSVIPKAILELNAYTDVPDRVLQYDAYSRLIYVYLQANDGSSSIRVLKNLYFDTPDAVNSVRKEQIEYQAGNNSPSAITRTVYDGFDGVWKTIKSVDPSTAGGSNRYAATAKWVDPGDWTDGNRPRSAIETYLVACPSDPWCLGLSGETEPNATETTYDRLGRSIRVENLDGIGVTSHGPGVRLEWEGGPGYGSREFDALLVKDAKGNLVRRLVDGDAQVSLEHCQNSVGAGDTTLAPGISCTVSDRTLYDLTPDGKIESIYDPAIATGTPNFGNAEHRIRYAYDTGGRMIRIEDPDAGVSTMTYFPSGKLETTTNSRGQTQTLGYDDLGRIETITKPEGEDDVLMLYRTEESKVWRESSAAYWKEFDYDVFGRVKRETRNQGGRTFLMDWEWDQLDRPVLITYPSTGMKVRFEYLGSYLKKICEPGTQTACNAQSAFQYVSDVQYDGIGRRIGMTHGAAATRTYGFNARYYVDHQTIDQTSGDYLWSYTAGNNYDALGNVTHAVVDETVSMATPLDADHVYFYDKQNRIDGWNLNNLGVKTFGYDGCGNLTDHEGGLQSFAHAGHRHAVSHRAADGESYTYDASGNVASITGGVSDRFFTFDSANRMVCVGTTANGCEKLRVYYDAAGARIRQVDNGFERDYIGPDFEFSESVAGLLASRIDVRAGEEIIGYRNVGNSVLRTTAGEALGIEPRVIGHGLLAVVVSGMVAHLVVMGGRLRERRKRLAVSVVTAMAGLMGFPIFARAGGGGPSTLYRRFVVNDPLGSGVLELSEMGSRVQTKVFRPFGALAAQQGLAGATPYGQRFAGHRFEENSGFYYMNARWMDAESGRFVSVDPIHHELESGAEESEALMTPPSTVHDALLRNATSDAPRSEGRRKSEEADEVEDVAWVPEQVNGFAYANNNPTAIVDPTGEAGIAGAVIGFGIGFGLGKMNGQSNRDALVTATVGAVAGATGAYLLTAAGASTTAAAAGAAAAGGASADAAAQADQKGVGNVNVVQTLTAGALAAPAGAVGAAVEGGAAAAGAAGAAADTLGGAAAAGPEIAGSLLGEALGDNGLLPSLTLSEIGDAAADAAEGVEEATSDFLDKVDDVGDQVFYFLFGG